MEELGKSWGHFPVEGGSKRCNRLVESSADETLVVQKIMY